MHEHEYVSEEMLCVLAQVAGEDNVLRGATAARV